MRFSSIDEADRYLASFCEAQAFAEALCFKLRLATEELASNMFKYTDSRQFDLSLTEGTPLVVTLSYHSERFDFPMKTPEEKPLSQMQEGGLGLFLVQVFTQTFSYRHDNGKIIYTFTLQP